MYKRQAYTIWRRVATNPQFGDPYLSVPAGQTSYSYADQSVSSGEQYIYRIAAKDCTPALSGQATTAPISVP